MRNSNGFTRNVYLLIVFCILATTTKAANLGPENAFTWGISNGEVAVPQNHTITKATLTVHDVAFAAVESSGAAYIHLLDNPEPGLVEYADNAPEDFFGSYGVVLATLDPAGLSSSDIVIELDQSNDPSAPVWLHFEQPFSLSLGDSTQVNYSSSMLSLLDYAGTGRSFGFGIDCDGFTFTALTLELTMQSLTESTPAETLLFQYTAPNSTPVMEDLEDQTVEVGQSLTFSVLASDADGDVLSYTSSDLPAVASFNDQTFTWVPSDLQVGTYNITFTADDGNGGQDSTTVQVTVSPRVREWTLLTFDDFESGWGNYTDGGTDCYLCTKERYAPQGSSAANIQRGSEESYFVLTDEINVDGPGYTQLKIDFSYYPVSMDDETEGFGLEYWDGSEWVTLQQWFKNIDFQNFRTHYATVEISSSDVAFPADMRIRFVCYASSHKDDVMIDEISILAQ